MPSEQICRSVFQTQPVQSYFTVMNPPSKLPLVVSHSQSNHPGSPHAETKTIKVRCRGSSDDHKTSVPDHGGFLRDPLQYE